MIDIKIKNAYKPISKSFNSKMGKTKINKQFTERKLPNIVDFATTLTKANI